MELDDEELARRYVRGIIKEQGYAGVYGPIPTFKRTGAAIGQALDVAKAGAKQIGINMAQAVGSLGLIGVAMFSPKTAQQWRDTFRQEILRAEQNAFEGAKQAWKPVWDKFSVGGDAAILAMALAPHATLGFLGGKLTIGALDVLTGGFLKEKLGKRFDKVKSRIFEPTQTIENADLITKIKLGESASTIMRFVSAYEGAKKIINKNVNDITFIDVQSLANTVQGYMNLYTRTNFLFKDQTFINEIRQLERQMTGLQPSTPEYKLYHSNYTEAILNAYSEIIAKLGVAASEYDKQLEDLKIRDPNIDKYKSDIKSALSALTTQYSNILAAVQRIRDERLRLEKDIKKSAEDAKKLGTRSSKPAQKTTPATQSTRSQSTEPTK